MDIVNSILDKELFVRLVHFEGIISRSFIFSSALSLKDWLETN